MPQTSLGLPPGKVENLGLGAPLRLRLEVTGLRLRRALSSRVTSLIYIYRQRYRSIGAFPWVGRSS